MRVERFVQPPGVSSTQSRRPAGGDGSTFLGSLKNRAAGPMKVRLLTLDAGPGQARMEAPCAGW